MTTTYLMIQNPGVAPPESFTLLGASTKRADANAIGKFGSGNKHGVAVLLRNNLQPIVFAGNLKLEFGTRKQEVNTGLNSHEFARVVVKYGGKDAEGTQRSNTEDLGFVLEYGATDWLGVDLALREFVSNSIDRTFEEAQTKVIREYCTKNEIYTKSQIEPHREQLAEVVQQLKNTMKWDDVVVTIVQENQVRAKTGHTRIFIPMNADVFKFYENLGKWFLHFSEPHLLNATILPKKNRNLTDRTAAVIYRRGVRVREFESLDTPSLFDYNLEHLELDESRKVDDWRVKHYAAHAMSNASEREIGLFVQSLVEGRGVWEHTFENYAMTTRGSDKQRETWLRAWTNVLGDNTVIAGKGRGETAKRKGFNVIEAPDEIVTTASWMGVPTPASVLSADEQDGREITPTRPDAQAAVDFFWNLIVKAELTNGKEKPPVKSFNKIMSAGGQILGFYRDGIVYINNDIAGDSGSISHQLLMTAAEELAHYVTGATDNSRDFQDYLINLLVKIARP